MSADHADRRNTALRTFRFAAASIALLALAWLAPATHAAQLSGRVLTAERPLAAAKVTIYAGGSTGSIRLGTATTDRTGAFKASYRRPP